MFNAISHRQKTLFYMQRRYREHRGNTNSKVDMIS